MVNTLLTRSDCSNYFVSPAETPDPYSSKPLQNTFKADVFVGDLPDPTVLKLRGYRAELASNISPVLCAAFAVLVTRCSGQELLRLVIGEPGPQECRTRAGIDHSNEHAAIDLDLSTPSSFTDVLAAIQGQLGANTIHLAEQPMVCTYQLPAEEPHACCEMDGPLALQIVYDGTHIQLIWTAHSGWPEAISLARLHSHFQTLLDHINPAAHQPISSLPLLTQAEYQQIVVDWNATACLYPASSCIYALFEEQVLQQPDAPALVFDGQILSYRELNERANQLARYLQRFGVGPETLVGICMDRSFGLIITVLAVLKAGGAYLPLDPTYPPARLTFIIADAQVSIVVAQAANDREGYPFDLAAIIVADEHVPTIIDLERDYAQIVAESTTNPISAATPDNLAYVIYTSGSTGKPKGVLLHHRGLVNLVWGQIRAFDITRSSHVLQFASFNFDASVSEIFTTLVAGATLHLARHDTLISPPDLVDLLRTEQITTVTLPPSLLTILPTDDLPTLRTVISAGERCPWELARRWSIGRRFLNAYGPTEATVGPTCYLVDEQLPASQTVPIGRPLPNYQTYILDRHRQPVPIGVVGELYIGGVGIARGYLNRPELTTERFVAWPTSPEGCITTMFSPADTSTRLYKTGDLARYLPNGVIEFLGRADHEVKLRGFRIDPGEIEAVLRSHPEVEDTIVLVREDRPGEQRLVSYLTTKERRSIELWPSVAEYFVYDELLYHAMTHDERRNASYMVALQQAAALSL